MRAIRLLLGKDVLLLRRSPALAGALIVYPLVVALLVGLVVRYAGERPRVALVAPEGLPSVLVVGKQTFDLQQLFDQAKEVKLVRMPAAQAEQPARLGPGARDPDRAEGLHLGAARAQARARS